jgi:monoamine oxidase
MKTQMDNMSASSSSTTNEFIYDCIIVGGGLSGLCAALELKDQGVPSQSILVLEAQDRVGGRILSYESVKGVINDKYKQMENSVQIDMGASFVGSAQTHIIELMKRLDIDKYPQEEEGFAVLETPDGKINKFQGVIPPLSILTLIDLQLALWSTMKLAQNINMERPWESPDAIKHDTMTLQTYIDQISWTNAARDMYNLFCRTIFGCEPGELSFLYFLYYVKSSGDFYYLINTKGGAQEFKVKGSAQAIPNKIASELLGYDSCVKLNNPVRRIDYSDPSGITTVITRSGTEYKCRYVILAIPPHMSVRIEYNPPMPVMRDQFCQRCAIGEYLKSVVCFKTKWWKDKNYSGFGLSIGCEDSPVECWFDATNHNSLVGFIMASKGRNLASLTSEQRKEAVLKQYSKVYGVDLEFVKEQCVDYVEKVWTNDEFIRGAPVCFTQPGALTMCGEAWRTPIGPFHFAGTETANQFAGYMSGAVEAGQRAAREVFERLSKQ